MLAPAPRVAAEALGLVALLWKAVQSPGVIEKVEFVEVQRCEKSLEIEADELLIRLRLSVAVGLGALLAVLLLVLSVCCCCCVRSRRVDEAPLVEYVGPRKAHGGAAQRQ